MEPKTKELLNQKLLAEKARIEDELKSFAKKSHGEDWEVKMPNFGIRESSPDEESNQYEEYDKLLELERSLEIQLSDINLALKKIKENRYGICETCGKEIDIKRLEANPYARGCNNKVCQQKFIQ